MLDIEEIDNETAAKLLRKALIVLSNKYKAILKLEQFSNGQVCIVSEDSREVATAAIIVNVQSITNCLMYFDSAIECLKTLILPCVSFEFTSNDKYEHHSVKFSEEFGNTIDEIKIKLDLLYP